MVLKRLRLLSEKNTKTNTVDRINEFLEEKYNAPLNYVRKPSHSPSGLGTKCYRKVYYQYWKVDKDRGYDAKAARIFTTGDYYEDMVVSWLKGIDEFIPYRNKGNGKIPLKMDGSGQENPQFPIKSDLYRIRRGYIDGVGVSNKELWIYEIKSKKAEKFNEMTQPDDPHLVQAGLYFTCFNQLLAAGEYAHILELARFKAATGIRYLYINKDNSEIKQFDVTGEDLNKIQILNEKKIDKANVYIDAKKLPPKTPDYCFFCPFWKKCKDEWNGV